MTEAVAAKARASLRATLTTYGQTISILTTAPTAVFDEDTGRDVVTESDAAEAHIADLGMYQPTGLFREAMSTLDGSRVQVRGNVFLIYNPDDAANTALDTLKDFTVATERGERLTPVMKPVLEADAPVVWRIEVGDKI